MLLVAAACSQAGHEEAGTVSIIPQPRYVQMDEGTFRIDKDTKIFLDEPVEEYMRIAGFLNERLLAAAGFSLEITDEMTADGNVIFFMNAGLPSEAYGIHVEPNRIVIDYGDGAGAFYALQTIFQLLPEEIFADSRQRGVRWEIPCLAMEDAPRFEYRGMHLDVCLHYFDLDFLKKYIDIMAAYTHTCSKELTGMPGSNASSTIAYLPSVEGPNNIKLHNSQYVEPDRVIAQITAHDNCNNHFSLIYEGWRGTYNYTYMLQNDMNGDGQAYDPIFIPTDAQVANNEFRFKTTDDRDRFMAYRVEPKWYVAAEALPCMRFYFLQEILGQVNPAVMDEIAKTFESDPPLWLVIYYNRAYDPPYDPRVEAIFETRYAFVDAAGDYQLLRLIEP